MAVIRKVILSKRVHRGEDLEYGITTSQNTKGGDCVISTFNGRKRSKKRKAKPVVSNQLSQASQNVNEIIQSKIAQGYELEEDVFPTDGCMDINSLKLTKLSHIDEELLNLYFKDYSSCIVKPIPQGRRILLELDRFKGQVLAKDICRNDVTIPDKVEKSLVRALSSTLSNCYCDGYLEKDVFYLSDIIAANDVKCRGSAVSRQSFINEHFSEIQDDHVKLIPVISDTDIESFIAGSKIGLSLDVVGAYICKKDSIYLQGVQSPHAAAFWQYDNVPVLNMVVTKVRQGQVFLSVNSSRGLTHKCTLPAHGMPLESFDVVNVIVEHDEHKITAYKQISGLNTELAVDECLSAEIQLGIAPVIDNHVEGINVHENESDGISWDSW